MLPVSVDPDGCTGRKTTRNVWKLSGPRRRPRGATRRPILPAVESLVATGPSRGAVDEALNSPVLKALSLNASHEVFARHGARHPLREGFSGSQHLVPRAFDQKTALSRTAQVPPPVVREVFLSGTPDEVIDQAPLWRDHGARYVVVPDASSPAKSSKRVGGDDAVCKNSARPQEALSPWRHYFCRARATPVSAVPG